jgi:hypothetical protein
MILVGSAAATMGSTSSVDGAAAIHSGSTAAIG